MSSVIKWVLVIVIVLLIINDVGAFAMSYWRAGDTASEIAAQAFRHYRETRVKAAAIYKARQLCQEEGMIFISFDIVGTEAKVVARAPVKGTFWLHRLDFMAPYLFVKVEGSG